MTACYVDTSWLVAIAFDETGAMELSERVAGFDVALSSTLLEAQLRSALAREGVEGAERLLSAISWVLPDRRLTAELDRVLTVGYARVADLQHLACTLYAAEAPRDLPFLTVDARQAEIAAELGFPG